MPPKASPAARMATVHKAAIQGPGYFGMVFTSKGERGAGAGPRMPACQFVFERASESL
jgi:hypothetical protein